MTVYRYNGPVNLTRMAHSTKEKSHNFTFYKGELYEGTWINKEGDYGDFVLNSGEEIECLDMTAFKPLKSHLKPKIVYPVTVNFDNGTTADCKSLKELKNEILDAHSEQSFPDSITDANGLELGSNWSVQIVII